MNCDNAMDGRTYIEISIRLERIEKSKTEREEKWSPQLEKSKQFSVTSRNWVHFSVEKYIQRRKLCDRCYVRAGFLGVLFVYINHVDNTVANITHSQNDKYHQICNYTSSFAHSIQT